MVGFTDALVNRRNPGMGFGVETMRCLDGLSGRLDKLENGAGSADLQVMHGVEDERGGAWPRTTKGKSKHIRASSEL